MGDTVDDDAALVTRCLSGDSDALRLFVERFQNLVFGICLRALGNPHDAEDVCQEVLLRAVRHLTHWDASRPLRPWLLTIAVNRCRTAIERRGRRLIVTDDTAGWSSGERSTPELAEELNQAVAALRPDYRMCFILFYDQQLSIEEIARALDCPTGTVKVWLHRARKQLAEQLTERGVVTGDGYELHKF